MPQSTLPFESPANVHCLAPNYQSISDLTNLLSANEIHTIISTLSPPSPEVTAAQDNLIRAAAQAPTVKRFIPSTWAIDFSADDEHLPLSFKAAKTQAITLLKEFSNLEFTTILNGGFLDYYGMPHAQSYMLPEIPYIDIGACKAAIPGTGDEKIVLTHTKDVAKFIRKMVESREKWPELTRIVGDTTTLNEVLEVAERVRGQKFSTVHDSLSDLRRGKVSEIPAYIPLYDVMPKDMVLEMMAGFGVGMVTGLFAIEGERINERYPEIEMVKMRDFIETHWAGRGA
ncbi:MAG: hypothetical protein L6R41_004544 [Letrouitia leprolyta]|nr:MAG: hypothetical protein L6R41_004544 [Letrouitia leprolyta]